MTRLGLVLSLVLCSGCTTEKDDEKGGGLGSAWSRLSGEYVVDENETCLITISGTSVGLKSDTGETSCIRENEVLSLNGTLTDTEIKGNAEIIWVDDLTTNPYMIRNGFCEDGAPGTNDGCALGTDCTDCGPRGEGDEQICEDTCQQVEGPCEVTITEAAEGTIRRTSGLQGESGPFAGLAGAWTGTIAYTKEEALSKGADLPSCVAFARRYYWDESLGAAPTTTESFNIQIEMSITGTVANITHTVDGETETFGFGTHAEGGFNNLDADGSPGEMRVVKSE